MITEGPSDRFGHLVQPHVTRAQVEACARGGANLKGCLFGNFHPGFTHAGFEPASRFWTMQLAETGLFAAAAIVLIGFAGWWTDRRAA